MAAAGEAKAARGETPLRDAADRLREAARWLVLTFGAVVAVVFAGISISRFGELDPAGMPLRFTVAAVGGAMALSGALAALLIAMSLASASTVTIADLKSAEKNGGPLAATVAATDPLVRSPLSQDVLLAPWDSKLSDFFDDVSNAQTDFEEQLNAWRNSQDLEPSPAVVRRASTRLIHLGQVQRAILDTASYLRLRASFDLARWWLAGCLVLATLGAAGFVWATGRSATASVTRQPRTGVWTIPKDQQDNLSSLLGGAGCSYSLQAVPVTVLDSLDDGKHLDVVTVPSSGCQPVRLVVPVAQVRSPPVVLPATQ